MELAHRSALLGQCLAFRVCLGDLIGSSHVGLLLVHLSLIHLLEIAHTLMLRRLRRMSMPTSHGSLARMASHLLARAGTALIPTRTVKLLHLLLLLLHVRDSSLLLEVRLLHLRPDLLDNRLVSLLLRSKQLLLPLSHTKLVLGRDLLELLWRHGGYTTAACGWIVGLVVLLHVGSLLEHSKLLRSEVVVLHTAHVRCRSLHGHVSVRGRALHRCGWTTRWKARRLGHLPVRHSLRHTRGALRYLRSVVRAACKDEKEESVHSMRIDLTELDVPGCWLACLAI